MQALRIDLRVAIEDVCQYGIHVDILKRTSTLHTDFKPGPSEGLDVRKLA